MQKKNTKHLQKLSAARIQALKRMPYLSAAVYTLVPIERPGIGTLGVTKDARMFYDPVFVDEMDDDKLGGVILHECMHVIQKHFDRAVAKGILSDNKHISTSEIAESRRWNIATDLEINDDLIAASVPLPLSGPYEAVTAKKFDLRDGELAETYYDQLRDQARNGQGQAQEAYIGNCGSCAGNPLQIESKESVGNNNSGSSSGLNKEDDCGRTHAELDRMRTETAQAVKAYEMRNPGTVPYGLQRFAEEIVKPPKVNWRQRLAGRIRKTLAQQSGMVDFSYRRPSRRSVCGSDIIMPSMVMPTPRIGVLVDTSGSMTEADLGHGLGQIRHVLSVHRADTYLAVCDTAVHSLKRVRNVRDVQAQLKGGGGTDLAPALKALDDLNCNLIVGISDCEAFWPDTPPRTPVVWLRCGGSDATPPFGSVIDIDLE